MITVERATLVDREILIDLMHRQFVDHEITYTAEILDSAIEEMLARDGLGIFLVAIENSQIIGFAVISFAWALEHGGRSAWLDELYVLSEYRGRGVGSALVGKVIEAAKKAGCKAIDLEVEQAHHRAERLYERKGFERLSRSRWVKPLS